MPEIKNTFTGGKMNKDLDERLVPNGEYRHAMNVQVSTSDDSNVGAIQNLLGNAQIPSVANSKDFCVGSISDEKSDALYWLNAGKPKTNLLETATIDSGGSNTSTFSPWESYWVSLYGNDGLDGHTPNTHGVSYVEGQGVEYRDTIFEYKNGVTNPVFVDVHTKWFKPGYLEFPDGTKRGDYLILPDNLLTTQGLVPAINGIQKGAKLNFYYQQTGIPSNIAYLRKIEHTVTEVLPQVDITTLPDSGGISFPPNVNVIKDVIKIQVPLNDVERTYLDNSNLPKFWFVEIQNDRILNYRKEQLITGLNIVDDMLFWTDNLSEPKKINITRSKQGTDPSGLLHTSLVVNGVDKNTPVKLENATVIKKAPTAPPTIEFETTSAPYTTTTLRDKAVVTDIDPLTGLPTVEPVNSVGESRDTIAPEGNAFWDWTWEGVGVLPTPGKEFVLNFQPFDYNAPNVTDYPTVDANGNVIINPPNAAAFGNIPYKNGEDAVGDVIVFTHRADQEDYVRCVIVEEIPTTQIDGFGNVERNGWYTLDPINVPYALWQPPFNVIGGVPDGTVSAFANPRPYHYVHQRKFRLELLSISQDTPLDWQYYDLRMEDKESNLFERKFPRLALRYRYEDGEYSSFGPFTDAVFSPGSFKYSAKDAENKAMVNNLKRIKVKDLINSETPEDVVQVDVVYKDEDSPNIYIVDNIKPDDVVYPPATLNAWNSPGVFSQGSYVIESESIFTVLPSNQLLRPFDNVPKKALAQDVTGNRIVYGNYFQDYDLLDKDGNKITPLLSGSIKTRDVNVEIGFGSKSVKSEREYQLGVVYSDKFGRESSVLSSSKSVFDVPKIRSDKANQIYATVKSPEPNWATHFKIFVKETTSEYYNLAMDRVYKAEDDGIWMSFPSAERNKVDEETYLILKKPTDSNVAVTDVSKYKVISISNEAPEYIKTSYKSLGEIDGADLIGNNINVLLPAIAGTNILQQNVISFNIDKTLWDQESGSALDGSEKYLVSFYEPISGKQTDKYEVINFSIDSDVTTINGNDGAYYFTLDRPISDEDGEWLEDASSPGTNVSSIGIKIYVKKIDNRPEFDGRFFVKIIRDSLVDTYITSLIKPLGTGYIIDANARLWWAADPDAPADGADPANSLRIGSVLQGSAPNDYLIPLNSPNWITGTTNTFVVYHYAANPSKSSQHKDDWGGSQGAKKGVIGNNDDGAWFIDNAFYAGVQPLNQDHPAFSTSFSYPTTFSAPYKTNYGKGIYQDQNGNVFIELSFSVLGDNLKDPHGAVHNSSAWEDASNLATHQNMISAFQKQDQKFIVNGDETQFKIVDFSVERRYNHTSYKETKADQTTPSNINSTDPLIKHYIAGIPAAQALSSISTAQNMRNLFSRADNRRITYILQIEPVEVGGDDFITFLSGQDLNSGNGLGPPCRVDERFIIEFISDYVDSNSYDTEISDNPTIWETEPKQKEGLDLYYEATRKFKGNLTTDKDVSELIPSKSQNPEAFSTISASAGGGGALPVIGPNAEIIATDLFTDHIFVGSNVYTPVSSIKIELDNVNNPLINLTQGNLTNNACAASNPDPANANYIQGCWHWGNQNVNATGFVNPLVTGDIFNVNLPNGISIGLSLDWNTTEELWNEDSTLAGSIFFFSTKLWDSTIGLSWYNCISFGNGVESDRIRDDFNALQLSNGVKVSRPGEDQYKEQHLKNSLIFSGLYNAKTGINNLNQFIAAEGITKDLNPSYGSIQKLHARDTDLLTLCEDKIVKILSNKDAVFNADENPQLLATNRVLGQTIPFAGEYGISKDPSSFASEAYRSYFTDRQRGKVIRLSRDGITPISDYGMSDYFNDNLRSRKTLYGSYDIKRNSYNLTLLRDGEKHDTISFSEKVKGWTSFKSFIPEQGLSLSGEYYTVKKAQLYQHHVENNATRNTFYGVRTASTVNVLLNANPEIVKNFQTLNYEGTQAKIDPFVKATVNGITYDDNEYYNLSGEKGWYVEKILTNCEHGTVNEFIDKECKWFNYIKGSQNNLTSQIDPSQFSFQGIGEAVNINVLSAAGCTDPNAVNYDPQAITDDGSCYYNPGCTDPTAVNYDPTADFDDGSCIATVPGCLNDPTAINYGGPGNNNGISPVVTVDDGSCVSPIYGCTDNTMFNYDPNANMPCDGTLPGCDNAGNGACGGPGNNECCEAVINGCTDANASNYNPLANTDDGSCLYPFFDCTDPNASNYNNDPLAQPCNNPNDCPQCAAGTNNSNLCCDYGGCPESSMGYSYYPGFAPNADPNVTIDNGTCIDCPLPSNTSSSPQVNVTSSVLTLSQPNPLLPNINVSIIPNQTPGINPNAISQASTQFPYHFDIAYRETGCVSSGIGGSWNFDNTTQQFIDTCVTHLQNVSNVSSNPSAAFTALVNNLQPGISYDFAIRTVCPRSYFVPSQSTNVYSDWVGNNIYPQNSNTIVISTPGCTDSIADNYDPAATADDGSCLYTTCTDVNSNTSYVFNNQQYSAGVTPHPNNTGSWVHDPNLCNYDVFGCVDQCSNNFDPSATVSCTNPSAQNNCIPCDYTCNPPIEITLQGSQISANVGQPALPFQTVQITSFTPATYTSNNNPLTPSTGVMIRYRIVGTPNWSMYYGPFVLGDTLTNTDPNSPNFGSNIDFEAYKTYEFEHKTICAPAPCNNGNGIYSSPTLYPSQITIYHGLAPADHCMDPNAINTVNTTGIPGCPLPLNYLNPVPNNSLCTYRSGCLDVTAANYIGDGTESFVGCPSIPANFAGSCPNDSGPPVPLLGPSQANPQGQVYDLTNVNTDCCQRTCPALPAAVSYQPTVELAPGTPYSCPANTTSKNVVINFSNMIHDTTTGQLERIFSGGANFPATHSTIDTVSLVWAVKAPNGVSYPGFAFGATPNVGDAVFSPSITSGNINTSDPRLTCNGNNCQFTIFAASEDFFTGGVNIGPPCNSGWGIHFKSVYYNCTKPQGDPAYNVQPATYTNITGTLGAGLITTSWQVPGFGNSLVQHINGVSVNVQGSSDVAQNQLHPNSPLDFVEVP